MVSCEAERGKEEKEGARVGREAEVVLLEVPVELVLGR